MFALDVAVRERLIPKNPTEGAIVPKVNYPPKQILTEEQVEKFLEVLKQDPQWYDFFYTELTTGMRRGEICGLMPARLVPAPPTTGNSLYPVEKNTP